MKMKEEEPLKREHMLNKLVALHIYEGLRDSRNYDGHLCSFLFFIFVYWSKFLSERMK